MTVLRNLSLLLLVALAAHAKEGRVPLSVVAAQQRPGLSSYQQQQVNNLTYAFKVCGYYCGPGWCADQWIPEVDCVAENVWGEQGDGCTDNCCRTHDYCCGSTSGAGCNDAIVSCIDNNGCDSLCADAVWAAMKIVSEWCCGSSCATYFDTKDGTREMSLVSQSFCNREVGLRFVFDAKTVSAYVVSNAKVAAKRCAASVPYALNQTSNRVSVGGQQSVITLPSDCIDSSVAGAPIRQRLMEQSKIWYFPNTAQLFVKDVQEAKYYTFESC